MNCYLEMKSRINIPILFSQKYNWSSVSKTKLQIKYFIRAILFLVLILVLNACTIPKTATSDKTLDEFAPCIYKEKSFTTRDVQWLQENAYPIDISTLSKQYLPFWDFSDISIVGIGEVVHGSHELYNIKIELTKYLIQNKDFRIIALEIPLPYTMKINEFLNGGDSDLHDILRQTQSWVLNTEEIYTFLVWAKEFNDHTDTNSKISITGYDIPYNDAQSEIEVINQYLSVVSPENQNEFISQLACMNQDSFSYNQQSALEKEECRSKLNTLITTMEANRTSYIKISSFMEFELAIKSLHSLLQLEKTITSSPENMYPIRDQLMKENVDWIHNIMGNKIIIWGHNSHIGKNTYWNTNLGTMGLLLAHQYGKSYLAMGSTFYEGSFNAIPLLKNHKSDAPPADSYETYLNSAGQSNFLISLNLASLPDWFTASHCLRNIGALYDDYFPEKGWDVDILSIEFDGFIFVENSTPTHLLDF